MTGIVLCNASSTVTNQSNIKEAPSQCHEKEREQNACCPCSSNFCLFKA